MLQKNNQNVRFAAGVLFMGEAIFTRNGNLRNWGPITATLSSELFEKNYKGYVGLDGVSLLFGLCGS